MTLRASILAAGLCLLPAAGRTSPAPGEPAPSLRAEGVEAAAAGDESTSKPMTIVFSKPGDAYTQRAIGAIAELHDLHPDLRDASRSVIVVSRLGGANGAALPAAPPSWRVLRDTRDALYSAYGIIATPTVAVVDSANRIVGIHAGYNADLAGAVWRDLRIAVHGPESLNAPTPTPGIMDVQMGRQLARRKQWDRALAYYRRAAEAGPLPCEIALEEVAIHIEIEQPAEASRLLDSIGAAAPCADRIAELRARIGALRSQSPDRTAKPPSVP